MQSEIWAGRFEKALKKAAVVALLSIGVSRLLQLVACADGGSPSTPAKLWL